MTKDFMQLHDLEVNTEVEQLANLFRPSEFRGRLQALREGGVNQGAFRPFWDQWGDKFVLRPRELSIFLGRRGSQKSTVVNYLIADYLMAGRGSVGLLSYEMEPEELLDLLVAQMANSADYSDEFFEKCMTFLEARLTLVDEMVDSPHAAIAKLNATLEAGCKLVVLDCLQRVNMPDNDINLEREFVVEMTNLVRKHHAHCVLVHHSKKGNTKDGDNPYPEIDDLRGSGGLADNAMNVVSIWANKAKKELQFKVQRGHTPTPEEEDLLSKPDLVLDVKKQRKQPFESRIGLWATEARTYHRYGASPTTYRG